jgi:nucleotide-binding universal stress UspA family protein
MAVRAVIAGVDGSEESLRAVEWAAIQAGRRGAPLRVVSAPAMPPRMHAFTDEQTVANALRGMCARSLRAAVTRSEETVHGLGVGTGLLTGPPALALTRASRDAALLVVGARGSGGFSGLALGSVSRYVATHAACPVAVVRHEASRGARHEIVAGIRDPQDAGEALAFAFEEAKLTQAELVVVHAWYWFPPASGLPDSEEGKANPARMSEAAGRRLAEALAPWRDKYPGVRVRQDVVHGHPGRVLASYTARADLVVLGRHGASCAAGPGIGSVQHAVLNHAQGTVAVVGPGE